MSSAMIVAGVMSGTSADGVDVAFCAITERNGEPKITFLGHKSSPYPRTVRAAVLAAMDAKSVAVADLARLNWRLGAVYADAIQAASKGLGVQAALIGCHGQTIYHQSTAAKYLGETVRATWQIGEAAVVSERLRIPVVSDFRPPDLAAGGEGAPLVPMLDYCLFRSAKVSRVLLNLGGIGNLTAIPAGADLASLLAFDTGPANMVVDGCMQRLYDRPYDRGGAVAGRGKVMHRLVQSMMRQPYFAACPPKSCGREEFGSAFTDRFIARCRKAGAEDADIIATATSLTIESIVDAYRRFVWAHLGQRAPLAATEYIVAGGGTKNAHLMHQLREAVECFGVKVRLMDELGVPAQAKEAVAFALLAWLTWHKRDGNAMAATGAARPVILGKVTYA